MVTTMSLPACEQRVLDTIESTLQRREPRLASMFAMFTRLTTNEGAPRTERLEARWWARRRLGLRTVGRSATAVRVLLLVPLVAMVACAALFVTTSPSPAACTPATGPHGPVATASHAKNCVSDQGFRALGRP
jgi:hypothetical protein